MPTEHSDTPAHSHAPIDMQALVRSQQSFVARILARSGVAERDVPDLVQEVFIVAHRRLPLWEGRSKLSTWLYRVAVRVASDHRRRAYQRREALPGLDGGALEAPAAELPAHERREQQLQLYAALDQLSAEHKQAFVGYEIEGLSVAELAERTQVPHKTIYSRLHAARHMMRRLLLAQGWTLLVRLFWQPKRCLAAWRGLSTSHALHMPLLCCLLLLTPELPPQPAVAAARSEQSAYAARTTPPVTPLALPPTAAPLRKRKRLSKPRSAAAPAAQVAPPAGLKVIHFGSVERPEGDLPFGFERVVERPAPRLSLRGPRDPVDGVLRELL